MPVDDGSVGKHTFWEHVAVLRSYILIGGGFFLICAIAVFSYGRANLTRYLLATLHGQTLVFLSPMGPFLFEMRIAFVAALIVSFPLWLFLLSRFAGEALPQHKRSRFLWFVVAAAVMAATSLVVSYLYLVPTSFNAFSHFIVAGTSLMLTADSYVGVFLLVTMVCFVVVELPVVLVALAYVRLVNPYTLARYRRYLFVGLLIMLGIITPTTDVVTLLVVTVPAMLFAELGLALAKLVYNADTS
jgi:sec-independent protein translocase protein TatC